MNISPAMLFRHANSLNEQLESLHDHLIESFPAVDRIACALYDAHEDMLKTFINSTRKGVALKGYEFNLSKSYSLSQLALKREQRVVNDIPNEIISNTPHARWVEEQGYKASFTVPLLHGDELLGFVFFDSVQKAAFTEELQKNLLLYCNLITMSILGEISAVRTLIESIRVARDLSEVRDFETGTHLERMARYSRVIAKSIAKKYSRTDEFVEYVYLFAPLHDIGKIGIPDKILLKPGPLDFEEREIMRGHVKKGVQIVDRIIGQITNENLANSSILRNIVGGHHEFIDGSGYPLGLKGEEVSLEARVVAVADIYDALTTKRPYKSVWTQEMALAEIVNMQEIGKLDRDCVDALFQNQAELAHIQNRYADKVAS